MHPLGLELHGLKKLQFKAASQGKTSTRLYGPFAPLIIFLETNAFLKLNKQNTVIFFYRKSCENTNILWYILDKART